MHSSNTCVHFIFCLCLLVHVFTHTGINPRICPFTYPPPTAAPPFEINAFTPTNHLSIDALTSICLHVFVVAIHFTCSVKLLAKACMHLNCLKVYLLGLVLLFALFVVFPNREGFPVEYATSSLFDDPCWCSLWAT